MPTEEKFEIIDQTKAAVKEAPDNEGAQAYGARNRRIIFRYLMPRIGAVMIPQLVILIPSYVSLEATLAFLEASDPIFPTGAS